MGAAPAPQSDSSTRRPRTERLTGNPILPNPREVPAGVEGVPPVTVPSANTSSAGLPPLGGVQRNPEAIPAGPPTVPAAQPLPGTNPGTSEPPAGENNTSYIRVREHANGGGTGNAGNGGENRSSSVGLGSDPLLRAQTLQAAGKYREALTGFREALAAGAAVGDIQQGIALCYQRLGEKAPARSAYQQAIQAFEAQVRAGRGVEQAQRGISACRAALDVLGS